jgi:hypothetical protein
MIRRNASESIKLVNNVDEDCSEEEDEVSPQKVEINAPDRRLKPGELLVVLVMMLSNFLVYIDRFTVAG